MKTERTNKIDYGRIKVATQKLLTLLFLAFVTMAYSVYENKKDLEPPKKINEGIIEIVANDPQSEDHNCIETQNIFVSEEMPQFPGGEEARLAFIKENLRYPKEAAKVGIKGTVFVSFIVEKDGSITNVELLRGIGGGCDEEAIRVTQLMPNWIPGKQRNKPVRAQFRMPVRFALP
jgi:TonB family protein